MIAASGAVVAAAAASLIRPIEVEQPLRATWRIVSSEPEATPLRVVRGAALVAVGVLVILEPVAVLRIVATLVGVYAVYKGAEALLRLISRPVDGVAAREPSGRSGRRARRVAVPVAATLLIGAALAAFLAGGGLDEPVPVISGCNGHAELCDRPLDEVALPATHNSMSVPLRGWFASLQERPIGAQLEDGIRGLLFDTHYADRLANGRTRTYFASRDELRRAIDEDGVSARSVEAAERLRGRLGFRGPGDRGMYLCHTFCELGATPLADVLDDIHEFLVTHPADVLVVRHAVRLRGCDRRRRPHRLRVRAPEPITMAHARGDDRAGPAARRAGGEPGRSGALVPARLPAPDPGDPLHLHQRGAAPGV